MWGWFTPKCPLDTWEKTWTETRMRWLAGKFGLERMLAAKVVLPTDEFFPEPYNGTVADAVRLLNRLRGYMGVARYVSLQVVPDEKLPGAAGEYRGGERVVIRINESQLEDPQQLIATLTHELAHELLLGENRLTTEVEDHEQITDLLLVFLGVGTFAANDTVITKSGHEGNYSWWRIGKRGYLPARMFGYAMSLFAFARHEQHPAWARHLRLDASRPLKQGLQFLHKTGDSVFLPSVGRGTYSPPSASEAKLRLQTGSPTVRMDTLWELSAENLADRQIIDEIIKLVDHGDQDLSGEAAKVLRTLGASARDAAPALIRALHSPRDDTRAEAAMALGAPGLQTDAALPALRMLLDDSSPYIVRTAAQALEQFGTQATAAVPDLLAAFARALKRCDYDLIAIVTACLVAISPDAKTSLREYFADNEELEAQALAALEEHKDSRRDGTPAT